MYGFKILCEISKGTFEISHKILNPYTAKYAFYCLLFLRVSYDIFELWCHKPYSETGPRINIVRGHPRIKIASFKYKNFLYADRMNSWQSYFHIGNPYIWMALYWNGTQVLCGYLKANFDSLCAPMSRNYAKCEYSFSFKTIQCSGGQLIFTE